LKIHTEHTRVRVGVDQRDRSRLLSQIWNVVSNLGHQLRDSIVTESTHLFRHTTNSKDCRVTISSVHTATTMSHEFSTTIKQHGSLPWDSAHMVLGSGYDMITREPLPSPFEEVDVEDSYSTETFPQVDVQAQVFRDEQELTEHLWSMASATSPSSSLASVKSMASYIKTAKCNTKNACLILRCTLSMPPEHFDGELDLTDTGRQMLNKSPQKFIDSFGEHCITGYIRQSSFFAVCTYSSTNAEELVILSKASSHTRLRSENRTSSISAAWKVRSGSRGWRMRLSRRRGKASALTTNLSLKSPS
jgi:hypothetical protein